MAAAGTGGWTGGVASAPDWSSVAECGHGLHGWLYGRGDHSSSDYLDFTSKWLGEVCQLRFPEVFRCDSGCNFQP